MFSYATCNDCDFMNAIFRSNEELAEYPLFEHQYPLTVAYINSKYTNKLRNQNAESQVRVMEKYQVRAANLQGCLLHMIARSGCKSNVAVVLAIGDTLGPHGSGLPREPKAVKKIVSCFIMAVVLAGLPKVYPAEGCNTERDVESGTDDEDSDSEENDDDDSLGQPSTSGTSAAATPLHIKPGVPQNKELDDLAGKIEPCWFQLGIRLDIEVDKLKQIQETEKNKPFEMLYHWKTTKTSHADSCATYQVLHDALCHPRVSRPDLAEMFCCQKP